MRQTVLSAGLLLLLAGQAALAQSSPSAPGAAPESRQAVPGGQTGVQPAEQADTSLWGRANLFGTLGGLRPALAGRGITFGLTESSEVFGNPTGGVQRAVIYEGLTTFGGGWTWKNWLACPAAPCCSSCGTSRRCSTRSCPSGSASSLRTRSS